MDAFAGIDVAFAKKKFLPISICVWQDGVLVPLPLRSTTAPLPPRGSGNAKILDDATVTTFAESTARYLRDVECAFGVTIRRITIDAPSDPKVNGVARREAEKGLDQRKISCIPTPDSNQFLEIRAKAAAHLASGGAESRLPHANQLWMLVGFELFRRLRQEWDCLEVFPQAIVATLGAAGIHKSKVDGLLAQLSAVSCMTGWPKNPLESHLTQIGYGHPHDNLDAYMAAWVASLEPEDREAIGEPPNDVIWVPRLVLPTCTGEADLPFTPEPKPAANTPLVEALEDVRIAFLQVEYAIKMLNYVEEGNVAPIVFDTDHTILLDSGNLGFPSGHFSDPDNIIRAANVSVSLALGASALTLDKAFEVAGIQCDPLSEDDLIKIRTLVYMVRCAYAHGIADPRWEVRGKNKKKMSVELRAERLEVDLDALHGQGFRFEQIGGHHVWFKIRDEAVAILSNVMDNLIHGSQGVSNGNDFY